MKDIYPYIKPYYVIIISILLVPILIKNSQSKAEKRKQEKTIPKIIQENYSPKEKSILRRLDFYSDSIKVCERSSEELIKYFQTGDTQYVKLYELKNDQKPNDYILALIDFLSEEGDKNENYNKYMRHHIPTLIFFIISIASIPGWVTCCSSACYNCCCFPCCKKPGCRLPLFIIVSILNGTIIITCILGIANTDKIFTGLTNTECSILRFINEMLEGESKVNYPRWGGVATVIEKLNETAIKIGEMARDSTKQDAEIKKNAYNNEKDNFVQDLKTACDNIKDDTTYLYDTNYILDIAKEFGKYENNNFTIGSYAEKWIKQAEFSDDVGKSYNVFGQIINSNIEKGIEQAESYIYDMEDAIEGIKDMIGETILDTSEYVDTIGRLIFVIIFVILLSISILIEALLIFLYLFSMRKCIGNCCCMNCFVKILIHIFWNVYAFIMVIIFLFGTALTLIGTIGSDIFQVFAFLISEQNLQSNSPKIIGDGASTLDVCMNGDGVIIDELGIENDFININNLRILINGIDTLFESIISKEQENKDIVYEELIDEINNKELDYSFELISSSSEQKLNIKDSISNLNQKLSTCEIKERLSLSCNTEFSNLDSQTCSVPYSSTDTEKCIDANTCQNSELISRYPSTCTGTSEPISIINKIFSLVNYIENNANVNSIKVKALEVKNAYRDFLSNAKIALDNYTIRFTPLTTIFDNLVGAKGSILDFLNCAFLRQNLKVLLSYLDDSVGNQFKGLGIIIFVTGIEIALSISFTILLVVIFNATIKTREEQLQQKVTLK